jgi:hypothetical protein
MDNVKNFDEYKAIEGKKKEPKAIDYVIAAPALIAGYKVTNKVLYDICESGNFGSFTKLGASMIASWLGITAYSHEVKLVKTVREGIVECIERIREDDYGDCEY